MTDDQLESIRTAIRKMAHDVRTPMTSVLGFTQLMLGDDKIDGENREFLELMEADIEKLNRTILDTLVEIEKHTT